MDIGDWSDEKKVRFLAILVHELTVCARTTYEVGTDRVVDSKLLRSFNEIEHRVTGALRDHLFKTDGMPLSVVLEMLADFGSRHEVQADINRAILRAEQGVGGGLH